MAITKQEFFNQLQSGIKWNAAVAFLRTNPLPIDALSVFSSIADLESYASGPLSYPGQVVAVVTSDPDISLYVINGSTASSPYTEILLDGAYENLPAAEDGQDVSLVTTGEKYVWDNKQDTLVAGDNIQIDSSTNEISATDTIPNDSTLTIQANGSTVGTFSADADSDVTINITAESLGLSAPMDFIGISTTDPKVEGATVAGHTTWLAGEVVIYQRSGESGYEEFVNIDGNNTSSSWELLGDADSYALKSIQINTGMGLTGGGDLTQNRTLSLADNYGDTKNPYGSKSANQVLASPDGSSGVPSFRTLTKRDLPAFLTVPDITALTSEQIEQLNAGDIVIKETGSKKHTYMVSYRKSDEMYLTYVDHENVEEVYYEKSNSTWAYIQTDNTNISGKQDQLTAGNNIQIENNVISVTDTIPQWEVVQPDNNESQGE